MTKEQAKSELMQIYGSLSEEKKQALDVVMAQNCDQCEVGNPCLYCEHEFKAKADRNEFYNWDAPIRHKADREYINRQAVIGSIDKWVKNMGVLIALPAQEVVPLFDSIHELPSVTIPPDHDGCKDCKHEDKSDGYIICAHCQQNYKDMWERKPHWIEHTGWDVDSYGTEYSCSNCNESVGEKTNFCPNCGAKMD